MKLFLLLIAVLIVLLTPVGAQETWSLEKCIEHALAHNIDLKIRQNNEQKTLHDRQQTKWAMLPSVNGWGSSGFDTRRSTNQNNEITTGPTYNISYGIGSSLTLFSGFTRINTLAALKYNEMAVGEGMAHANIMLTLSITELFAQVIYQQALVKVVEEQLANSKLEAERIAAMIEAGLLETVAQLEIDASVSGQELQLNRARNNYKLTKLKLAHLIEIPEDEPFDIGPGGIDFFEPKENLYTIDGIYMQACQNFPTILQREYEMAYYKKMLDVAKGYAAPSIGISGSYSSAFFSTDTLQNGAQTPLGTQLGNYLNPSVGLSLSVPIFNGRRNSYNIKNRKIDIENALFALENQKRNMRREIEEALMRLEALRLEYLFALNSLTNAEKSFETFRERYRLGLVNNTEFVNAQNQLAHAQSELLRAKYSWVVQYRILELYKGNRKLTIGD